MIDSDLTGYRVDNIPQNVEVAEDFEEDIDLKAAHRRSVN